MPRAMRSAFVALSMPPRSSARVATVCGAPARTHGEPAGAPVPSDGRVALAAVGAAPGWAAVVVLPADGAPEDDAVGAGAEAAGAAEAAGRSTDGLCIHRIARTTEARLIARATAPPTASTGTSQGGNEEAEEGGGWTTLGGRGLAGGSVARSGRRVIVVGSLGDTRSNAGFDGGGCGWTTTAGSEAETLG